MTLAAIHILMLNSRQNHSEVTANLTVIQYFPSHIMGFLQDSGMLSRPERSGQYKTNANRAQKHLKPRLHLFIQTAPASLYFHLDLSGLCFLDFRQG